MKRKLSAKGSRRNNFPFCCRPPGPLARRERRAIPGAVCEERATKPAGLRAAAQRGAAAKGAYRLCCRSSTMSDIAFVAAPRICPPGARAKVFILFLHRPLGSSGSTVRHSSPGARQSALRCNQLRTDICDTAGEGPGGVMGLQFSQVAYVADVVADAILL